MRNPFNTHKMEEESKPVEDKKDKNILTRIKESVDEKEEQIAILSTFVRLGILVWSGCILTLAYIKLPPKLGIPEQKLDPTFIASVFTGVLATFGVQAAKKGGANGANGGVSKGDLEALIKKAAEVKPHQTVTIEHNPITLKTSNEKYEL